MVSPDSVLSTVFGFEAFRPGQQGIIDTILSGRNVLAVMPTGAGKSLCYQVPALIFDRPTVIVSPLVALMDNQVAGLRAQGVAVACIHSGQSRDENIQEWRSVTHGDAQILYMSPERLMSGRMMAAMRSLNPAMFVVDEAHCVSKWGPAFRPEYDQLSDLKSHFPDAVMAAFTATADELTRQDIADKLFGGKGEVIVHGFDRPNLDLNVTPKSNRKAQLLDFMTEMRGQSGIVYCLSRKTTEETASFLMNEGFTALPYHAGLPSETRFIHQERFMAEDGVVIVATIAFGMGIDKPDIRFVFHMNLPGSLEAYYQEIGRAGRDGAPASTAMLYGLDDVRMRRQFISDDGAGGDGSGSEHQMREHKRLDALLSYCEASGCRRQVLLSYFGEATKPCGNCDNCLSPPKLVDASDAARAVFGAVEQTGERFGTAHIIDVVRGADTARIRQFGHNQLTAYGAGQRLGKPYLQALIRQAVSGRFLTLNIAQYGALQLTAPGRDVLVGRSAFLCKEIIQTARASKSGKKAKRAVATQNLSEADQVLLAQLKAKRMAFAQELGKPAYVVFSDATLIDMAQRRPTTKAEMLEVNGVGAVKFERFGREFLAVIGGG